MLSSSPSVHLAKPCNVSSNATRSHHPPYHHHSSKSWTHVCHHFGAGDPVQTSFHTWRWMLLWVFQTRPSSYSFHLFLRLLLLPLCFYTDEKVPFFFFSPTFLKSSFLHQTWQFAMSVNQSVKFFSFFQKVSSSWHLSNGSTRCLTYAQQITIL